MDNEFYTEINRIISEETEKFTAKVNEETKKFTDTLTKRCISFAEQYKSGQSENQYVNKQPVLDSIEDILSSSRPLSKAELREKKKQEKIDAKFKRELNKKGF
ncbi:MAG: hypothetical protein NC177_00020 [Ruminococcus flavefaciens]|nr:hypothetical protein [Ruminococcus flavefaciens]